MANPDSDVAGAAAEWVAKSTRARARAATLEEKARSHSEDRPYLLELARKLRVGASIFERRVRKAQMEGGKPPFWVPSESSTDSLPAAREPNP